jgi:actin, other eukaryote
MTEKRNKVVIDFGSSSIKSGFSGSKPRSIMPSIIGYPKEKQVFNFQNKSIYIGDLAELNKGYLRIEHGISDGIIQNWETFEKLTQQVIYNELRTEPKEGVFLMTEPNLGPLSQKEKKTQIMFESFDVEGFYLAAPPRLAHLARGGSSSFVIDIGDTVTETMAIVDGFSVESAVQRFNFGGRDITNYLIKLMTGRGLYFQSSSDYIAVKKIKEQLGCVSSDFKSDLKEVLMSDKFEKSYELPDQKVITLGAERFQSFEALFNPSLVSKEIPSVNQMVYNGIQSTDLELHSLLYQNVFVSGATSLVGGFTERLESELKEMIPKNAKSKIIAPFERRFSTWIGGSILSSLSSFQKCFVTKDEYEENGPSIIHYKTL